MNQNWQSVFCNIFNFEIKQEIWKIFLYFFVLVNSKCLVCVCVCVCVCIYLFIYTISISFICVSQEELSLLISNQITRSMTCTSEQFLKRKDIVERKILILVNYSFNEIHIAAVST